MERSYSSAPLAVEAAAAVTAAPLSAVSWGAVLAGAAGAASLSLVLAFLGVGLGMSSISPWAGSGASAEALGVGSILWITLTQIAAAAVGGYLAGRLRTVTDPALEEQIRTAFRDKYWVAWAGGLFGQGPKETYVVEALRAASP